MRSGQKEQEGGEICVSVSLCPFIGAHNANAIMQTFIYYYMQTLETHILGNCFQRVCDV